MYTSSTPNYLRRSLMVNDRANQLRVAASKANNKKRVKDELRGLGLSRWALLSMSSRYLQKIIHPGERLCGAVYGHQKDGMGMLVATDRRVIFIDKKPLFLKEDEITYDVVSGVSFNHAGLGSTLTLHTRIKDYTLLTVNNRSARNFVEYIERNRLEQTTGMGGSL